MLKFFPLAFFLILTACVTSPIDKTGVSIEGTWIDSYGCEWVFAEGVFKIFDGEAAIMGGTYTTNGRTITTQFEFKFIDFLNIPAGIYSRDQLQEAAAKALSIDDIWLKYATPIYSTMEEVQEFFKERFDKDFAITTNYYSIRGDTLFLDWYDWPLLSLTLIRQNIHSEPKTVFLGLGPDLFAVAENNTVTFYDAYRGYKGDIFEEHPFILPSGYTSIVGFDMSNLGVIVGNTMIYYSFTNGKGWNVNSSRNFTLPSGYKSVVGFNRNTMGVVVGNTLIYYRYIDSWKERLSREMTLPNGYVSIIGLSPLNHEIEAIGVIVGNTLKQYVFSDGLWQEEERAKFILPADYSSVIGLYLGGFGVIAGNTVQLYEYWDDEKGFVKHTELPEFTIEW
ncbi:MAG: hypothetical protein LBH44_02170 [Treponema sp.]|jgi:hypothetical protein|nr:hypothetical protein [Treponema sp.]